MQKDKYLVDVPVEITIWTRTECQKRQFEVIKEAKPSKLFLISDGGRSDLEWEAIRENRSYIENEIDWQCEVHKLYEEKNNGMYAMWRKIYAFVWSYVDRCIFLEDDYVPAVSYFRYCAELLEKYKDDLRIEMITGHNVFVTHPAAEPNDYFFSEEGWSIWGTATWKNRMDYNVFPLEYSDNKYVVDLLKKNLSAFWFEKARRYCAGELADGHVPGAEYFHAINSVLFHRMSIVPTKNMICNIGMDGEHANSRHKSKMSDLFKQKTYEISFPLKHPQYVIDDVEYGRIYSKKLGHSQTRIGLFIRKVSYCFKLLFSGRLLKEIHRRRNRIIER